MSENNNSENVTKIDADARYFLRGDKAENWETLDPILHEREVGLVLNDSKQTVGFKIGDGTTPWKGLPLHAVIKADDYSKKANLEPSEVFTCDCSSSMPQLGAVTTPKDISGYWFLSGDAFEPDAFDNTIILPLKKKNGTPVPLAIPFESLYLSSFKKDDYIHISADDDWNVEITKFKDVKDKQDKLTPGNGISIEGNQISANIPGDLSIDGHNMSWSFTKYDQVHIDGVGITAEGFADPIADTQVANKRYVDDAIKNVGGGSSDAVITNLSANLGANILTSEGWTLEEPGSGTGSYSNGWSGDYASGFKHASSPSALAPAKSISIPISGIGTDHYLVKFMANPMLDMNEVTVSLGNSKTYDLYTGQDRTSYSKYVDIVFESVNLPDTVKETYFDITYVDASNKTLKIINPNDSTNTEYTIILGIAEFPETISTSRSIYIDKQSTVDSVKTMSFEITQRNEKYYTCGIQSEATNADEEVLVITAIPKWKGTISNITVQKISGVNEAERVIRDVNSNILDEYRYNILSLENIWHGYNAGKRNVTGCRNVGVGYRSLENNTSGFWNISIGGLCMLENRVGSRNIGIGQQSLMKHKNGLRNIAIGSFAMSQMTSGNFNNGVGVDFMLSATGGEHNNGIGYVVLAHNTTGIYNVGLGGYVLSNNTTGSYNVGAGGCALYGNTTGIGNFGLGWQAIYRNTTGRQNVGIGHNALAGRQPVAKEDPSNFPYSLNIGIGCESGYKIYQNSIGNTFIGAYAGREFTQGENNIFIGYQCGRAWKNDEKTGEVVYDANGEITGSKNIMIGYDLKFPHTNPISYLNIGNLIIGNDEVKYSTGAIRYYKFLQFKAPVRELSLDMNYLPTEDPGTAGTIWNDNGVLKVSTGGAVA